MQRRTLLLAFIVAVGTALIMLLSQQPASRAASNSAPYFLYHPAFSNNIFGADSTLQLDNLTGRTANITLTLYGTGAGTTYSSTRMIDANTALVIPDVSLSGVPNGIYAVNVESDQPLESLIHTRRTTGEDPLMIYGGSDVTSSLHFFGPYLKGTFATSLVLFNPNPTPAQVNANFRNLNGSSAYAQDSTIPAYGTLYLYASAISALPTGFSGAVQITADQPVMGIMFLQRTAPYDVEAYPDPGPASFRAALPRAFKAVDEGSGPRTTTLFVGNPGTNPANIFLNFYDASGSPVYSQLFSNVAANGSAILDLSTIGALPVGRYSVSMAADQAVIFGSYTYHPAAALYPVGDYEMTAPSTQLQLPYVARSSAGHTIVSLQNVGVMTATGTISYYNNSGVFVASQLLEPLKPGQAQPIDQAAVVALPTDYVGYALLTTDQPVQAVVDEYLVPPCVAPNSVQIDQTPPGVIYTNTPITFTVTASGTQPFNYAWTIDSIPLTVTTESLEGEFIQAGQFTVGVTVTNACGADYAGLPITVQPEPPDLSLSYKTVNLTHVGGGDILTYTLVLHNMSNITATALLTDPLPAHMTYVPDSVSASSGSITFTLNELHWQGTIISGMPVVVQYAAQVAAAGLTPGDQLTNTAQLDDGLGNVRELQAVSTFDPGFRLTINNGALYTNIPTVTLALSWQNEAPPITQMQISNDGGFASGTGWIAANASYAPWTLTTYGTLQLPRVVYARFRDSNGLIYGPIQDDIIYDPVPPQITQLSFVLALKGRMPQHAVTVRVAASDDNSGTATVQLSDRSDFASYQSYPTTGTTTDVPWSLSPLGLVYVRVSDRAGNLSTVSKLHGPGDHDVFLPLIRR